MIAKIINPEKIKEIAIRNMWERFGDVPIDDADCITEKFFQWPAGTNRFDIWHWFDERYEGGVARLIFTDDINQTPTVKNQADTSSITEKEYTEYRVEQCRKALMQLLAKFERPGGDPLTGILIQAVYDVEILQEEDTI